MSRFEAHPSMQGSLIVDWVVLNVRADMIVASRLTETHAKRIAEQLNRADEPEGRIRDEA